MTALAPAEVVGADPAVIAAPIDGVIGDLPFPPNSKVGKGDLILQFVDTKLRNDAELAGRARAVAEAKLRRLVQVAFESPKDARDLAIARAELALAEAEWRRARDLLARSRVRAPVDGVLIYSAKTDWIGKPVATGERIMDVVDPARTELRIELPVSDAIALAEDARVAFFPDGDPLAGQEAKLTRPGYRPLPAADGKLAYRSYARLRRAGPKRLSYRIRGIAVLPNCMVALSHWGSI